MSRTEITLTKKITAIHPTDLEVSVKAAGYIRKAAELFVSINYSATAEELFVLAKVLESPPKVIAFVPLQGVAIEKPSKKKAKK